ncbi:dihydrofolate reductase family protein [Dyadobacter sp. CY326]|uniref:dihydrofolate reductase family protein n=1 Tax=Dyadobacter sp. CY326 TaxID=2907300 RepID=UPI001F27D74B|nr:dihydrofolate reductase family protein [Dyadobacter sp. CY326]MCE7067059.1 dihydrofolate reductase family protein [Dyadobacter sp. CY326]
MRKIIAAINMTLDGFCDHTAVVPDETMHQHYADLLRSADITLYGRKTYQLMEYWKSVVENPTGDRQTDEFAIAMDRIPKVVFSHTLETVDWDSARIAERGLQDEVLSLKEQAGRDILVGSRSVIIELINLRLVDELQIMVHPVIAGSGLPLFEMIHDRKDLTLVKTKTFDFGAVILYYKLKEK